ncbi:Osteoclast-stimulating factor 1 [Chytriomyces hyalinus]|nr:Osteoclast-stimulating factor 1 [Chytriomyces hyalinus]
MPPPPVAPKRKDVKEIAVVEAKFAYTAQNSDELSFEEGDILYVIQKDDGGWWKCRSGEKEGLVPANYVGASTQELENPLHGIVISSNANSLSNHLTPLLFCTIYPHQHLFHFTNTHTSEAAKRGNTPFVAELLAAGISVNGLDKAGNSPLHWAARSGKVDCVRLLLAKGPAVNARNKLGDTPLHNAAWGGHLAVVSLLLQHRDIKADIKNNDGSTPRDLAKTDDVGAMLIQFQSSAYTGGEGDDGDESD